MRPRLIQRSALLEGLDAGTSAPLTVVTAPAGSGKTVMVRSWLKQRPDLQAGWVSVERGEHDAQVFWSAVVDALRAAASEQLMIGSPAPTPDFNADDLVSRLISALERLDHRVVLVIDDLHELHGPAVLDQLARFLDRLPDSLHVVLLSRRDPRLALHRRRLVGELTELRDVDLRFTRAETREMLAAAGVDVSDAGVALLHERTEGWAAGLRLAAVSMAAAPDPEAFVAEFSGSERTVAEYLLAEVLDTQPADVRRLLVRTSLLERVNGALGDLLTGGSGAERALQDLADAGGFVVALDPGRTWFRFHRLFADLLSAELRRSVDPVEILELHRAAARWHSARGSATEAIIHAHAAGDRETAAGLLLENYFTLTLDGRQATAHGLLAPFAGVVADDVPELIAVLAADQLAEGSLDQAAAHLAIATRHAEAVPVERRHRFEIALLVTRLSLARRRGDFRSVLGEVRPISALGEVSSERDIALRNDVRALMLLNLGIVEVWSGRTDDGARTLEEAREIAEQIGRPYLEVQCLSHWAQAMCWRSFTRARAAAQEAITLAESHGWGADAVIGPALATLGTGLAQAGRLAEAERTLSRAERVLRADLEPAVGFLLHMGWGAVHSGRGAHAEASMRYRAAERLSVLLVEDSPLAMQHASSTLHTRLALGDHDGVSRALAEMSPEFRRAAEICEVAAELALIEDDPEGAVAALAPNLSGDTQPHHRVVIVRSLILDAIARDMCGEGAAAEADIERALDLTEADALILPFLHTPSRELLERHPRHRTAHGAFLAEILDLMTGTPQAGGADAPNSEFDELSDAELRVLRLLPTNLTASSIADELYLSVNTVKTHMRRIYAKLGAHTRIEAVELGRRLGLLGHYGR